MLLMYVITAVVSDSLNDFLGVINLLDETSI